LLASAGEQKTQLIRTPARNIRKITEFDQKNRRYSALCDLYHIAAMQGPALFIFPSG
jgi:hypothetical protein